MDQPQTPLLKLFIIFYSLVGGQYTRPQWLQLTSLLHLLWNVTFNLLVIYGLVHHDPLRMRTILQIPCVTVTSRPLFTCFVNLSINYAYPFVYLMYATFGILYGHRIIHALDSEHFRRFYHCKRQARLIFAIILILNHASLVTIMMERHRIHRLTSWPSSGDWLEYISLYVIFQYVYWLLLIKHYYQYATYRILKELQSKVTKLPESEVLAQIRSLAHINHRLNQLLSPITIIYTVYVIFNYIFILCLVFMCSPNVRIFIHIYCISCYAQYIGLLNGRVRRTVAAILASLQETHSNAEHILVQKVKENNGKETGEVFRAELNALQSQRIIVLEGDLYERYFAINVFQISVLDMRFLFGAGLFIVGYVVFLMQTN